MNIIRFTLYGFIEDTYLHRHPRIVINNEDDQGLGRLNSILQDYFSTPVKLRDLRPTRDVYTTCSPSGEMAILVDNLTVDHPEIWELVTNAQLHELFKLVETMIYAPINTDLNSALASISTLGTYVDSTAFRDTSPANCMVSVSDGYATLPLPRWIQFQSKWWIDENTTYVISFKLYLSGTLFAENYPITTITKVIPPYNPEYLFTAFPTEDILSNLVLSHQYLADGIHETIKTTDQTGMYLFSVRYRVAVDKYAYIPFQIYYKGAKKPSEIKCRIAVKEYLINLNMVDNSTLVDMFPDLYIENYFYFIPLWDEYITRPNKKIYNSCTSQLMQLYTKFNNIYPMTSEEFLEYTSILSNGQNNIYTLVYTGPLSLDKTTRLKDIYPTYIDYSTSEINFQYMDTKDRVFAILLNKAYAILQGTITLDAGYKYQTTDDGLKYLVFSTDKTEVRMLTPESYMLTQEDTWVPQPLAV